MKSIVIASNPFGFGPSSKASSTIRSLIRKKKNDFKIYYIGSSFSQEIIENNKRIEKITLNERSEDDIKNFLLSVDNVVLCIGFQNRFIVRAAKELSIPCFFIDGLAWLWKEIPQEHFDADIVFWTKHPLLKDSRKEYNSNKIRVINNFLFPRVHSSSQDQKGIVINLGGGLNPLRKGLQENYLTLIVNVLNEVVFPSNNIYLLSSKEVCSYLLDKINNPKIQIKSLVHNDAIELINKSTITLSTGGLNSSIESIYLSSGLIFILPSNLSQIKNQQSFVDISGNIFSRRWNDLLNKDINFDVLEETEVVNIIEENALKIDERAVKAYANEISKEISRLELVKSNYTNIKNHFGRNGSEQLAENIIDFVSKDESVSNFN